VTVLGSSLGHDLARSMTTGCRTARSAPRGRPRSAARCESGTHGPHAAGPRCRLCADVDARGWGGRRQHLGLRRSSRGRRPASAGCRPTGRTPARRCPACARRTPPRSPRCVPGSCEVEPGSPSRTGRWWWPSMRVLPQRRGPAAGRRWRSSGCSRCRRLALAGGQSGAMSSPSRRTVPAGDDGPARRARRPARLAVALDAGDADDLAADREADVGTRSRPGRMHGEPATSSARLVGDRALARLGGGELAAHHQLGELAAVTELGSTSPTVLPWRITVIASACLSTSSSLWEMKMMVAPSP
jgi:hypothetical protein